MSDDLSKVGAVTLTADQAAMLRKMLDAIGRSGAIDYVHGQACIPSHLIQEARDAVALLPEPVDADLVEARRIAAARCSDPLDRIRFLNGENDDGVAVPAILAGLKRGRELGQKVHELRPSALERDSREG